jgi:hypothetical protein
MRRVANLRVLLDDDGGGPALDCLPGETERESISIAVTRCARSPVTLAAGSRSSSAVSAI